MALSTNDLKNGMALDLPEGSSPSSSSSTSSPARAAPSCAPSCATLRTKAVIERTFRADEKVEQAMIDKREMQFLYRDGQDYVFMDNVSYDQLHGPGVHARRRRLLPEGGRLGRDRRCTTTRSSTSTFRRRSSS